MANLIVSTTQQQRADEPRGGERGSRVPRRPDDHRGAPEPHRGGDPRLRPVPLLRHARARADARC
ncbi:MAG: hypothetical protein MZU79_06570 [Anaerotruncus sp.]|nr:hypothetical protein [Anaerotruncus sp.]